jgi:hypothetical protein
MLIYVQLLRSVWSLTKTYPCRASRSYARSLPITKFLSAVCCLRAACDRDHKARLLEDRTVANKRLLYQTNLGNWHKCSARIPPPHLDPGLDVRPMATLLPGPELVVSVDGSTCSPWWARLTTFPVLHISLHSAEEERGRLQRLHRVSGSRTQRSHPKYCSMWIPLQQEA